MAGLIIPSQLVMQPAHSGNTIRSYSARLTESVNEAGKQNRNDGDAELMSMLIH